MFTCVKWFLNGRCYESELVQNIVGDISKSIFNQMPLSVAKYPVGIDSRVEDVLKSSNMESNDDISIVGIYGLGE